MKIRASELQPGDIVTGKGVVKEVQSSRGVNAEIVVLFDTGRTWRWAAYYPLYITRATAVTATEAKITINGKELTDAQSATVRVAIADMLMIYNAERAPESGDELTRQYIARATEVQALIFTR